jgi:hypothetical protein
MCASDPTLTLDPDVALLGLSFPNEQDASFAAVERFRALLLRRRRFDFDAEVHGLSRVEQAVAFLALLELRKEGEIAISQAQPFAPIRVSAARGAGAARPGVGPASVPADARNDDDPDERIQQWTARSA